VILDRDDDEIECRNDDDCDDNSKWTEDVCVNPGTEDSFCEHNDIECFEDIDCGVDANIGQPYCSEDDVVRDIQTFICVDPGTADSFCDDEIDILLVEECNGMCFEGSCEKTMCGDGQLDDGEQCDDGNLEGGDGCTSRCTLEDDSCEGADYIFDFDPQMGVVGEGCHSARKVDSRIVDILEEGEYDVYAIITHRTPAPSFFESLHKMML